MVSIPKADIMPAEHPTQFYLHYGPNPFKQYKDTNRSGYTPTSPLIPNAPRKSKAEWETRKYIENFQMLSTGGFTTRELKAMEAIGIYNTTSPRPTLTNSIHPIFNLDLWESQANMPLQLPPVPVGGGQEGYWEARNPVVWTNLQPALRLASAFLDNVELWPWWDALVHADLQEIGTELRSPMGSKLYRFRARDESFQTEPAQVKIRKKFAALGVKITWAIGIGRNSGWTRQWLNGSLWYGVTETPPILGGGVRITLSCDLISPLFRDGLTEVDRRMLEFQIAVTAVHELCHGLWSSMSPDYPQVDGEPYFEDEPISELGLSLQSHIFGGTPERLNPSESPTPVMGMSLQTYPLVTDFYGGNPILYVIPQMLRNTVFPVPTDYFARIQQEDFWKCHVGVFGALALRFDPLGHGRQLESEYAPGWVTKHSIFQYFFPHEADEHASAEDRQGVNLENEKRLQAVRIQAALYNTMHNETEEAIARIGESDLYPAANDDDYQEEGMVEDMPTEMPARFEEIRNFLFQYRRPLAMDTMVVPMPEDLVLAYINRTNLITITPQEWRQFVQYCTSRLELFVWRNRGPGEVERFGDGWPALEWYEPTPLPEVPFEHQELMKQHMAKYSWYYRIILPDNDKEIVRRFFNKDSNSSLTPDEFDALLGWCDSTKQFWTLAPAGMMRFRSNDESNYSHMQIGYTP